MTHLKLLAPPREGLRESTGAGRREGRTSIDGFQGVGLETCVGRANYLLSDFSKLIDRLRGLEGHATINPKTTSNDRPNAHGMLWTGPGGLDSSGAARPGLARSDAAGAPQEVIFVTWSTGARCRRRYYRRRHHHQC